MTDVARLAGCSQATVSFVLNNAPGVKISDLMRDRVIEAARSLNYATAQLAHLENVTRQSQADMQPRQVGFVVDQLATSPEAVVAIEGARQALWHEGNIVLTAQTMNDPRMEEKTIRTLLDQGASGLIYMTIFTRKIEPSRLLRSIAKPLVLLNCYTEDDAIPAIVPAEFEGGTKAVECLVSQGHTRIGMITGEPWMEATRARSDAYGEALKKAGIAFDPELIQIGDWSPSAGYEATRQLLSLSDRPTAIFSQNDRMAIGCYEAIKEAGLRIPHDISVVGYDDEEIARHLFPQLTTVVLPHRAMGRFAIQLVRELESSDDVPKLHEISGPLIERSSVTAPIR